MSHITLTLLPDPHCATRYLNSKHATTQRMKAWGNNFHLYKNISHSSRKIFLEMEEMMDEGVHLTPLDKTGSLYGVPVRNQLWFLRMYKILRILKESDEGKSPSLFPSLSNNEFSKHGPWTTIRFLFEMQILKPRPGLHEPAALLGGATKMGCAHCPCLWTTSSANMCLWAC